MGEKASGRYISPAAWTVFGVCLVVAVVGVCLYHDHWAKPWVPNIVIGALTVGFTTTVVQAVLTKTQEDGERERVKDLVAAVLDRIRQTLHLYLLSAANSYMSSNLGSFPSVLPSDQDEWMTLLVNDFPKSDNPDPFLRPGVSPVLLASALRDRLLNVTDRYVVVLLQQLPNLLVALDDLDDQLEVIERMNHEARQNVVSPADQHLHEAMQRALMEARDFAEAYAEYGPPISEELIQDMNADLAERHADRIKARSLQGVGLQPAGPHAGGTTAGPSQPPRASSP
jgi:hypothetical protein